MCGLCKFWSQLQRAAYKLPKLVKVDPASLCAPTSLISLLQEYGMHLPTLCPLVPCNMDCGKHQVLSVLGMVGMAGVGATWWWKREAKQVSRGQR